MSGTLFPNRATQTGQIKLTPIRQDIARQAQERAKQNEQPDSPIKTCPLAEAPRADYQEQGEVESTEKRYGMKQIQTRFHRAGLSIPLRAYFVAPQPEQR